MSLKFGKGLNLIQNIKIFHRVENIVSGGENPAFPRMFQKTFFSSVSIVVIVW